MEFLELVPLDKSRKITKASPEPQDSRNHSLQDPFFVFGFPDSEFRLGKLLPKAFRHFPLPSSSTL
jgi:hypothetical protein